MHVYNKNKVVALWNCYCKLQRKKFNHSSRNPGGGHKEGKIKEVQQFFFSHVLVNETNFYFLHKMLSVH